MFGPKMPRISVNAVLEYSKLDLAPNPWISYTTERQNSRRVPSPAKSDVSGTDYSNWPSFYGKRASPDPEKEAFLGQYIHRIYCRECREQENMAAAQGSLPSAGSGSGSPRSQPGSPPQYQMDQLSLAEHMSSNKQVLNRKLMVRRSVHELVDAGIYPTSPHAFAGQRILLERAKTGDILKHKIERRPDREFLVQHHILDDSTVDPSLQSMQRKLKKAKLTDELNDKLAHRPGPLELVEQRILEVKEPIKAAIEGGQLEFHKADEAAQPPGVAKVPYVVESPKSGHSSPEPSDWDDSNNSSNVSTGFNPPQVPSPPDISPLLNQARCTSITIGGRTRPVTGQPFPPAGSGQLIAVPAPYHRPQSLANRHNRRSSKSSRSKQPMKQRVIKFHEYKGPPTSKSSNSSSVGSFVTTTGPMQKLDDFTPHEMRVHQQNLYLQCQMEVENKTAGPAVLLGIKTAPATPLSLQQLPGSELREMQEPPTPKPSDVTRSRPETPSVSMKSPTIVPVSNAHTALHLSRSLSHLEDLKVADLKQELKRRDLTVSGSKPQLIERLREHQLKEMSMSASIPSVSSTASDFSYSSNLPSVQSFSDEAFMAPPSVSSSGSATMAQLCSPPQTPCSPMDDFMRSPMSTAPANQGMETDDTNSQSKSTAAIVREQAKQIEVLQRQLMQFKQQYPMVQQPFVVTAPSVPQKIATTPSQPQAQQMPAITLQQMQELLQQRNQQQHDQNLQGQTFAQPAQPQATTPIDITDKQVYVATADGKMTAYKVILHTGNGLLHQVMPKATPSTDLQTQVAMPSNCQIQSDQMISSPNTLTPDTRCIDRKDMKNGLRESEERSINVDDVIDVLIKTGEMDPRTINDQQKVGKRMGEMGPHTHLGDPCHPQYNNSESLGIDLHGPFSSLVDMDWIESNSNCHYLDGFDNPDRSAVNGLMYNGNSDLEWLSDAMHLDIEPPKAINSYEEANSSGCTLSTSDPLLSPKPPDLMNIFDLDESDFKVATESGSDFNWDKLISQASHNF